MKYCLTASSNKFEKDDATILLKEFPQISEFNPTIEDGVISIELNTLEEFNEFCKRINNEIIITHYYQTDNCIELEIYNYWRE